MQRLLKKLDSYVRTIDYIPLVLAAVCSGFGLALIYSATAAMEGGSARYMTVQTLAVVLGLIGFVIVSCLPYEKLSAHWRIILIVNIALQLMLIAFGSEDGGNRSWLRFGGIGIQPGEIGKILFVFTFARQISLYRYSLNRIKSLLFLGVQVVLVTLAIIIPSHDVGVALCYVFAAIIMMFAAGLSMKWFGGGIIAVCAAAPVVWHFLDDIKKNRILVLFDPSISPTTYWQQEQSRIAIGAGRIFGAGFMKGMQTQYNMLPEKQTDFIFGVAGEEWGLLGCLLILVLLNALIFHIFFVAYRTEDQFLSLLCVGVGAIFLYQTYENIFMCLGIGPVIGLTLPFFSYGGSSMLTMYLAIGMVAGVSMHNKRLAKLRAEQGWVPVDEIPPEDETTSQRGLSIMDWKVFDSILNQKKKEQAGENDMPADSETPEADGEAEWVGEIEEAIRLEIAEDEPEIEPETEYLPDEEQE